MAVVDDVAAAAAATRLGSPAQQGEEMSCGEEGSIRSSYWRIRNEPRGNGAEDAAEHEPAAGGDAHAALRRSKVRIPSAPPVIKINVLSRFHLASQRMPTVIPFSR
jgi:hypothetical protein